ncbi:hypothetical protein GCM10009001_27520 [Virgibacillus siamensis]|uniref:Uncharacterized protein n=1 Tax=Virgibacillus siamensis TaxID=480071 RepID=A0ABN1GCM6_9BACI
MHPTQLDNKFVGQQDQLYGREYSELVGDGILHSSPTDLGSVFIAGYLAAFEIRNLKRDCIDFHNKTINV